MPTAAIISLNNLILRPSRPEGTTFDLRVVFDGVVTAIRRGDLGLGARAVEQVRVTLHESHIASASFDGRVHDTQ